MRRTFLGLICHWIRPHVKESICITGKVSRVYVEVTIWLVGLFKFFGTFMVLLHIAMPLAMCDPSVDVVQFTELCSHGQCVWEGVALSTAVFGPYHKLHFKLSDKSC